MLHICISIYANDHFKRTGGDCHADGCAFAYLARAIGYKDVYACLDVGPKGTNGHCWTEIGGKVYDPLFAQAKSFSKNYDVPYGVYKLPPIIRIAIMEISNKIHIKNPQNRFLITDFSILWIFSLIKHFLLNNNLDGSDLV